MSFVYVFSFQDFEPEKDSQEPTFSGYVQEDGCDIVFDVDLGHGEEVVDVTEGAIAILNANPVVMTTTPDKASSP